MLADKDRIFTNIYGFKDCSLKGAMSRGHWDNTKGFIDKGRDWIIDEMKASGLRGRGGAGFPTGLKWSFMPKQSDGRPHYLVVNADESEPGTCKDREILRHDPHTLIEGCVIAGCAMGAHTAYIYLRGEFMREREALQAAIDECYDARLLGKGNKCGWDMDIILHHGAGAYICGEETALLESLEGKKGQPRLAAIPGQYGPLWLPHDRQQCGIDCGRADDPASRRRMVLVHRTPEQCRHQAVPDFRSCEHAMRGGRGLGITFRDLIEKHAGGIRGGFDNLLAVIPGGASCPVIKAEDMMDAIMDFDGMRDKKSSFGTGGLIVMDKSTDIIKAIARLSAFFKHESCGQCTPCREGTGWMWRVMERMVKGNAQKREIDMLFDVTKQIEGHTICALGDAAAWPVQGLIRNFRPEIEKRIDEYTRNAVQSRNIRLEAAE